MSRSSSRRFALSLVMVLTAVLLPVVPSRAAALPSGFQQEVVFGGLTNPSTLRFASDGRVFVAEKGGLIKVFDSLSDTTPTTFADLRTKVHNFWDRGLLGLELAPNFPADPFVYVLYTYDAAIGGTAPRWGSPNATPDPCPTPPAATTDGCVVSGRLSRLQASGNVMTGSEQVLIEDWCQQYPSHSIGDLQFGPDGALYVSGGDGASFTFADYGQKGFPQRNPCGDPPTGVGGNQTAPTAEGGGLRSQDLRTTGDPVTLDGAILRVNPQTGAGMAGNPMAGSSNLNARRIIAYGMRNPFRFTFRPGSDELWFGDVGWSRFEEINRITDVNDATMRNFGWPCYEGTGHQDGYGPQNLNLCEDLYDEPGATTNPYFAYAHQQQVANETCGTGSSSTSGMAFYTGGSYPAEYDGALFFADYSRSCIWVMRKGANGLPDPATRQVFMQPNAQGSLGPVDLVTGPDGDLFFPDYDAGTIVRIRYFTGNEPPTAVIEADETSGPAPLVVNFDGTSSTDPENAALTYAWDLDGDGAYDDSTSPAPSRTYAAGNYTVGLQVTDPAGGTDTDSILISSGNTPPAASIDSPSPSLTWKVGDVINFAGSSVDGQDPNLPPSAYHWSLILHHCSSPGNCHTHTVTDFPGVKTGSFNAPDHDYPSFLELKLTVTDSGGLQSIKTVNLDPKTVDLTFETSPPGLQLSHNQFAGSTPFTRTVIVGSSNSISAPGPQTLGGTRYKFSAWSDGGGQTHNIVAPATNATLSAEYVVDPTPPGLVGAWSFNEPTGSAVNDASGTNNNGTIGGATRVPGGKYGGALSFDGTNDLVTIPDANSLDLTNGMTLQAWVRPTATGGWRTVMIKETPNFLAYGLYGSGDTNRPLGQVVVGGTDGFANGASALATNTWTHLATTYDGTAVKLFVNGIQAASTNKPGAMAPSTGPLRIGGNTIWGEWFSGLIDEVRVYNRALSLSEIQSDMGVAIEADGQAPTAPTNLSGSGGLGTATLNWNAATDNVAVTRYNLHRSTSPGFTPAPANRIAQPTATNYADSGLAAGTYYYRVTAEDAAGNISGSSNETSAVVTADTTAPNVSVTSPTEGATVSGTVDVSATATDNVGVTSVQFKLDGSDLGLADTSAPYSIPWNTLTATNGPHTLRAVALDAAGNSAQSTIVQVSVNNTAPSGLVGAWSFNEGSGNTVNDASGKGNPGTITGATRTTSGMYGGALTFDGVNDWVTVADSSTLDLTTALTMEAWVRPTGTGGWRTIAIKETPNHLAYAMYGNTSGNRPSGQVVTNGLDHEVFGTSALTLLNWTHLAMTWDGTTQRYYANGALVSSKTTTGVMSTSTGALRFGGNSVWGEYFTGQLDELRLYNRALSAPEITSDMNTPVN